MTIVLGLTGGIATGKSTVSAWLKTWGYTIVDADVIARQVVALGTPGLAQITAAFSEKVLQADGSLNRAVLGQIVFNDDAQRQRLMQITAPLIRDEILAQRQAGIDQQASLVVLDIPLLFETDYQQYADVTWVVSIDHATQQQRLMQRNGLTAAAADARINSQWPLARKRQLADVVIDNNGSLAETKAQVLAALQQLGLTPAHN
jgi:dephospho-CoA kinase